MLNGRDGRDDDSEPRSLIVLSDQSTPSRDFIERNLVTLKIKGYFVDSTKEFLNVNRTVEDSQLIVISTNWNLFLLSCQPQPSIFVVRWQGSSWAAPWENATFEIRDPFRDDALFQRHILAWLDTVTTLS